MKRKIIHLFIIFIITISTFFNHSSIVNAAEDFQFESVVTSPETLTEENLKWAEITMTITNDDTLVDPINPSDFHIHNQPGGVSVESVTRIDDHTVLMKLDYDWTDLDTDDTDFHVDTAGGATVNGFTFGDWYIPIQATVEELNSLKALTENSLSESNLNGAEIELVMSDDDFEGTIYSTQFVLNNAPAGVSIANVRKSSNNRVAIVTLAFDGTDFDSDITNFSITALDAAHKGSYDVTSNDLSITAVVEPSASMNASTTPNELYENSLDGSVVHLTLDSDGFESTLNSADIQLNEAPAGLSVSNVTRFNDIEADVTLAFDGTDFDVDYPNFSVEVLSSGLKTAPSATSNSMVIYSINEIAGEGNYIATGEAYPTLIEMVGYNTKVKQLYLNTRLHTDLDVAGKVATFNYFIKIYNGAGMEIGSYGDITSTYSVSAALGEQDVDINNIMINLLEDFPVSYRIVVTVESVTLS